MNSAAMDTGVQMSIWVCTYNFLDYISRSGTSEAVQSCSTPWTLLDFVTPWTRAYQAPPSMEFSGQEYWSELPFASPGYLPNPGIEPRFPALQANVLPSEPPGKPFRSGKAWLFSLFNYFEGLSHCFLKQL